MAITPSQQSLSKFFTKRKQQEGGEPSSSSPPPPIEESKSESKRLRLEGQTDVSSRDRNDGNAGQRRQDLLDQLKLNGQNENESENDKQDSESKRQRHALYVKRLKISNVLPSPASSSPPADGEDTPLDENNNDDEEVEEESELTKRFSASTCRSKPSNKKPRRRKFTPLEQQVIQLKEENPGTILMIEVGYKYRFFGQDAAVASKELNIFLVPGWMNIQDANDSMYTKFASASIPVQRLHVHVRRLINKGYRVGVVRQIETAAIKAAGANKSAPFNRKLTDLFTKGTYVDEFSLDSSPESSRAASNDATTTASSASRGVLCISEEPLKSGNNNDDSVKVGTIAVRPEIGDVTYDSFTDGFSRGELETRILHIQPAELVIVGDLSKSSEKLVSHMMKSFSSEGAKLRVERLPKPDINESQTLIREFYASASSSPEEKNETLEVILNLPPSTTGVCLSSMIELFRKFSLEHVFNLLSTFHPFLGRSHMLLNGNTISNLEIFYNSADRSERGSLFWLLNNTRTKFGERLLRRWVGQPLVNREELEKRSDAVDEILDMTNKSTILSQIKDLLTRMIDLEKGLVRIHYGRCSRKELLFVLRGFDKAASTFFNRKWKIPEDVEFRSPVLNQAIFILPSVGAKVKEFLSSFNHTAALYDNKTEFFDDSKFPQIEDINYSIEQVNQELTDHIIQVREILQKPHLEYTSVANEEFLIEVRNTDVKRVPKDWIKISGTRICSRFHSPQVRSLLRELERLRETLNIECDRAYAEFQAKVSAEYQSLRSVVEALSTLDCLMSLAETAMQPDYVKPVYVDEPCIEIEQGRHPMVEMLLSSSFVANNVSIGSHKELRGMLITGPNMGGKSSYVRQVALLAIMGQVGSYVPAKYARLGMLDAVYTRMGAYDNMLAGESTFMVELNECSEIIKKATSSSLVILDEIGRGTGTMDGVAIAYAVLDYFISEKCSLTLFVTHYPSLAIFAHKYKGLVDNFHMGFIQNPDNDSVTFLYKLVHGVAHRSYGFNVARLANLPESLLTLAASKAHQLEMTVHERQDKAWTLRARKQLTLALSGNGDYSNLVHVKNEIDNI